MCMYSPPTARVTGSLRTVAGSVVVDAHSSAAVAATTSSSRLSMGNCAAMCCHTPPGSPARRRPAGVRTRRPLRRRTSLSAIAVSRSSLTMWVWFSRLPLPIHHWSQPSSVIAADTSTGRTSPAWVSGSPSAPTRSSNHRYGLVASATISGSGVSRAWAGSDATAVRTHCGLRGEAARRARAVATSGLAIPQVSPEGQPCRCWTTPRAAGGQDAVRTRVLGPGALGAPGPRWPGTAPSDDPSPAPDAVAARLPASLPIPGCGDLFTTREHGGGDIHGTRATASDVSPHRAWAR